MYQAPWSPSHLGDHHLATSYSFRAMNRGPRVPSFLGTRHLATSYILMGHGPGAVCTTAFGYTPPGDAQQCGVLIDSLVCCVCLVYLQVLSRFRYCGMLGIRIRFP